MKTLHLVAPRTGPGNEGTAECLQCGATIFLPGGLLAYDPEAEDHTTDEETYALAGTGDLQDRERCS